MSKILITGASGFIGTHLIDHLSSLGCVIDTINRGHTNAKLVRNEFIWEQLAQINVSQYTAVIHLAGMAHDTSKELLYDKYEQANIELFRKLLLQCLKGRPKKLILFSTIKVFESAYEEVPSEEVAAHPDSVYGSTKLAAEKLLGDVDFEDMGCYILRPTLIFGQPFKGNLRTLANAISKNIPLPLAGLANLRSYLSVENLMYIVERIVLTNKVKSGVYHLADDRPLKTNELLKLIANAMGKSPQKLFLPYQILYLLGWLGELTDQGFDMVTYRKVTSSLIVGNDKIKLELDIDSFPFNLSQKLSFA